MQELIAGGDSANQATIDQDVALQRRFSPALSGYNFAFLFACLAGGNDSVSRAFGTGATSQFGTFFSDRAYVGYARSIDLTQANADIGGATLDRLSQGFTAHEAAALAGQVTADGGPLTASVLGDPLTTVHNSVYGTDNTNGTTRWWIVTGQ